MYVVWKQNQSDLAADGHGEIQGCHGVLEDHGEQLSPQLPHIPFTAVRDVGAIYKGGGAFNAGHGRQQLHHTFAQHDLPASGFPMIASTPLFRGERHISDRLDLTTG